MNKYDRRKHYEDKNGNIVDGHVLLEDGTEIINPNAKTLVSEFITGKGYKNLITEDVSKLKYYAVFAKCGHCGKGYFIPKCFAVKAINKENALLKANNLPRVQRDREDWNLGLVEIPEEKYILIKRINDNDPYLRSKELDEDSQHVLLRRIKQPEFAKEETHDKFNKFAKEDAYGSLKQAGDFPMYLPLQRAFAPTVQGTKCIYPSKGATSQLLDEFFKRKTISLAYRKQNPTIASLYLQIYGRKNPLHIYYDGTKKELVFPAKPNSLEDSVIYKVKANQEIDEIKQSEIEHPNYLSETQVAYITKALTREYKELEEIRRQEMAESSVPKNETPVPSALDKFNSRMAKTQALKNNDRQR